MWTRGREAECQIVPNLIHTGSIDFLKRICDECDGCRWHDSSFTG
jgi:hypothetical protein